MAMASPLNLADFPDSPYAAQLRRPARSGRFAPAIEAEYTRSRLNRWHAVIRVICIATVVLVVLRGVQSALTASWLGRAPASGMAGVDLALVGLACGLLAWLACSPWFERLYLPCAQIIVPVRNLTVAVNIAYGTVHGQIELLMILPMMIIGPFFFLGLPFRTAMACGALTVIAFVAAAVHFNLALSLLWYSSGFLLVILAACAIAAWQLNTWSRVWFLESRLIAELAERDALTGTKNRRVFDDYLTRLWNQAIEDQRTLAVLLLDVDHFKAYNDRYGHQAGDQALRRIALAAQKFVTRPLDVLARYGGEEFGIILYDVDSGQAQQIAEQIRRAAEQLPFEHPGAGPAVAVTISVGVAAIHPTSKRNPRGALQLADQALYEAKRRGRNRVVLMDQTEYSLLVTGVFSKVASSMGADALRR